MFSFKDSLVIFDISNTYFETGKHQSKKAKYGRSKEKRSDCPLVVFTAVINREGFIRHSRIYEGNKADVATLEDMIKDLEANTTGAREKTIVIDAGIADDKNLELIDQKGYKYVCVSRKRLRDYTLGDTTSKPVTLTTKSKEKVELQIFHPQAYQDTWMYVERVLIDFLTIQIGYPINSYDFPYHTNAGKSINFSIYKSHFFSIYKLKARIYHDYWLQDFSIIQLNNIATSI
jgi:hypothetical protein